MTIGWTITFTRPAAFDASLSAAIAAIAARRKAQTTCACGEPAVTACQAPRSEWRRVYVPFVRRAAELIAQAEQDPNPDIPALREALAANGRARMAAGRAVPEGERVCGRPVCGACSTTDSEGRVLCMACAAEGIVP